jgi:spermidine synthase
VTALAVVLLSAATLAFQILIVRVFAIEQFHHFATMAIGVAMLGIGASGTAVALARPGTDTAGRWFPWAASLTALSLVASPLLLHALPVDPTQLAWRPGQWPRLVFTYVVLAVPFGFGALAVLLAIVGASERPGSVYGASFVGSGLGAVGALAILAVADPARALAAPAVLAAVAALVAGDETERSRTRPVVAALALALGAGVVLRPPWRLGILAFKALPQAEALPDAERVVTVPSPTGWVAAVSAPAFRFAPGLSLAYRHAFPRQTGLFVDADLAGAATAWDSTTAGLVDWMPAGLPYALGERRRVLVFGAGGMDLSAALRHGADVTAVELHPALARLVGTPVASTDSPRLRWVFGDARAYVARTPVRFDLIAVGPTGGLGGVAAGVQSLNEDFLRTAEAVETYLSRLTDDGVLAVTTWLALPPRGEVRAVLTAAEALRRRAPAAVAEGLVVLRSWGTATVLIKPSGFTEGDIKRLEAWAESRWFDVDWRPGLAAAQPRFNFVGANALFDAARAATESETAARRFSRGYPFRVAPATDARPYPNHFLGLTTLGPVMSRRAGDWLPFAEWGPLVLLATVTQAAVIAALCILLPTLVRARGALRRRGWPVLGYFGAIGLGYLAAEIGAIQQLTLLLGHPVYAVSAVLTVLLLCSGAGSTWSDRLRPASAGRVAGVVALLLVACAVVVLPLVHRAQAMPLPFRVLVGAGVLGPLALLMGMPFPLGLRALAGGDVNRAAWAWAANGFASVVAAPLGAIVALELGSPALFGLGAACYLVAWVAGGTEVKG